MKRQSPRGRRGSYRLEAILPPQLAAEFLAAVQRRASHVPHPVSWAAREALAEWCARPDLMVPADLPFEDPQLEMFPGFDPRQEPLAFDQADREQLEEQLEDRTA